jgi:transcriptional regulator with XRE-family HTH domain
METNTDPRQIFAYQLKRHRLARGMTQEALADEAGLDRTYVSSCERGKRNISITNIYKLARALKIGPEELVRR